ncbi:MAG TPA: chemotaxis protein CheD [Bryobacteraceae bacterium]|nr:chemotaxis protein CheD [Bryobacteraceae bacterium]
MKSLVVGISDCKVSNDQESTLITYALGSCIAVVLYDPATKVGGLLHYMLPESALDVQKAQENPYMFADTGIKALLKEVAANGAQARRMVVRLAGGAQVLDSQGVFQIGKRNYLAARRILWKAGVLISAEAVGGEVSRTTRLDVATGRMWIREAGGVEKELVQSQSPKKAMEGA